MKVAKEIRIIALDIHLAGESFSEELEMIAEKKMSVSIVLEPNSYDSTCIAAKIGTKTIGVVNKDDKRYVMQLLSNGVAFDSLRFHSLYKKDNETPIIRCTAWIDLEKVEPITAGQEWSEWNYKFPVIERISDWSNVDYIAGLLERAIMDSNSETKTIDDLVEQLTSYTRFDISVETTIAYENLAFMLEMHDTEQNAQWKHRLQRASTERRTKRTHEEKLPDWWNMCLASPEAKDLRDCFASLTKEKYGITDAVIPTETFLKEGKLLEQNLQKLPYGLYEYTDSLGELYHRVFYRNIPRQKLKELLSALVLKDWLDKMNSSNQGVGNTYYYVGRDYIQNGDNIYPGGTKVEGKEPDHSEKG
ncbi:MAG: hypothetical protein MJZ12_03605 [Prevotella sp.]|nr:hypothetical protein [Prevotella sp.]